MKNIILLIDDDDNICKVIRLYLEKEGYTALVAHDGPAGLDLFSTQNPDLVLLDIMLPDISGYEIIESLRADPALRAMRVLLMTARGSVVERRKGLELGADGFIAKPFELNELRAEIARLLAMA